MDYRHEWKHNINYSDMIALRQSLQLIASPDKNAIDGRYHIRSIYFDNLYDTALREKIDGVNKREKFRIRLYNNDTSYITLEKKSKINGLCSKQINRLTLEEAKLIQAGEYEWMRKSDKPLVTEVFSKMQSQGIKPKTIVDYDREPYIYGPGNVRVTFDYNIRTGLMETDFLNPDCITIPAGDPVIILEVKWDEFLPDVIKNAIQLKGRQVSAFSKYVACRIYG